MARVATIAATPTIDLFSPIIGKGLPTQANGAAKGQLKPFAGETDKSR
jgi:hypothetical protein